MIKLAVAMFTLVAAPLCAAGDGPPRTYESWGVCPFECCTYRTWTAAADVPVHARRSERSPVLFHARRGERVDGVTGVVVTRHPAPITIAQDMRDGYVAGSETPQLALRRGDVVYMLSPMGEGTYLFWYRGKVYRSSIDMAGLPGVAGKGMQTTWWKQVRNASGRTGWTSSDKFQDVDACG